MTGRATPKAMREIVGVEERRAGLRTEGPTKA
jgi:hypothetical protein